VGDPAKRPSFPLHLITSSPHHLIIPRGWSMVERVEVGSVTIGAGQLAVIAGPCVIESVELCVNVASSVRAACDELGLGYIFKASFDKANRTSLHSFRGPGLEKGLEALAAVKCEVGVPVLTDIHEAWQAERVAEVVDVLQIPAFLARQTDLLVAAARTGRAVNVKKAQFMSPWDMRPVVEKLTEAGSRRLLLTERGTSFGYNNLVVDFRGLAIMRSLGFPVVYDATHSLQLPGGQGSASGAQREYAPHLMRAAAAVGIDALFLETHPDPDRALSDAAAQLPLAEVPALVHSVKAIHEAVQGYRARDAR
jgi:2-dehydro-3-deoxyphosphooctonate aldolase (KDO 8-P synthase)